MSNEMNLAQATELHTLLSTCRPTEKMDTLIGPDRRDDNDDPGCLLCQGHREGLYSYDEACGLDMPPEFSWHFGCTLEEAQDLVFLGNYQEKHFLQSFHHRVTGEDYYQKGKLLLEKYGYGHLFVKIEPHKQMVPIESVISFEKILELANKETANVE